LWQAIDLHRLIAGLRPINEFFGRAAVRDVIVVVDPDNQVEESDESNNNAVVAGVCN
jgi:hypothetical protein